MAPSKRRLHARHGWRRPAWLRGAAAAWLAALAPTVQAVSHPGALPATVLAQREAHDDPVPTAPTTPRVRGSAPMRSTAPLGVPQVNAPAQAAPSSVPASSSPRVPPRTLLAPAEAAVPTPTPRQTLAPATVRPGLAGAASAVRPGTSAECPGQPGPRECLLPGPRPADWHQQTGAEIDPVTGARLVPGVHLNPPKAP